MDRYLIAVDMDGTLLDSRNKISDYTINVLKKLQEKGHYVIPASGRCLTLLPPELKSLEKTMYAITENGAIIWDLKEKEPIVRTVLSGEEVENILSQVLQGSCFVEIFANGAAYTERKELCWLDETIHSENFIRYFSNDHIYAEHLERMEEAVENTSKINLYFKEDAAGCAFREAWKKKKNLTLTSSMGNVEITSATVSKGTAVRFLMKKLGIPKRRVLVFGDGDNDLEMFEEAGIAVAMTNAAEYIRNKADYIAPDNDHDGVAVFLENYFEEET